MNLRTDQDLLARVLALPSYPVGDGSDAEAAGGAIVTVPASYIDENGHMNIQWFFKLGAWAPWLHLQELGIADDAYLEQRRVSFFTVEHHIRYLSELREGERFSVRTAFAGRTAKALHAVAFVVDETRQRLACVLEVMYVHVSLDERRATPIPDDVLPALDADLARHPWVADVATGLSLR